MPLLLKYLITATIVVIVSEVARRSGRIGALIASLPLFLAISPLLSHGYSYWQALGIYALGTLLLFLATAGIAKAFGVELLG